MRLRIWFCWILNTDLPEGHRELTGQDQAPVAGVCQGALETAGVPMIIRHVVVPGITDGKEELETLGHLISGSESERAGSASISYDGDEKVRTARNEISAGRRGSHG